MIIARKLGEPCADPLQCSVTSQNSTCNDTSNVCECEEGYLEVLNTCTKGRLSTIDSGKTFQSETSLFFSKENGQLNLIKSPPAR